MADPYKGITQYLKLQNFHYLDKWVTECVDYFRSNRPNLTNTQLQEEVHQQWLYLNLRDLKLAALPPNLKAQTKIILPGKYALQVETLWDCGQSMYSQWQTLRNASLENVNATKKPSDELSARRCLRMNLTDGVQEVSAMEYDFIPALKLNNPDLPPGFKILVIGPVVCRKGMLLLKSENVKVLGGEVDVFHKSHSLSAILAAALGIDVEAENGNSASRVDNSNVDNLLDGNDDDFSIDDFDLDIDANGGEEFLVTSHQNVNNIGRGVTANSVVNRNNVNRTNVNSNSADNDIEVYSIESTPPAPLNQIRKLAKPNLCSSINSIGSGLDQYFNDADDILCEQDSSEISNNLVQLPKKVVAPRNAPKIVNNRFETNPASMPTSPKNKRKAMSQATTISYASNLQPKRQTSMESFLQSSHSKVTANPQEQVDRIVAVKALPFVYLAQIVSLDLKENTDFKVKAIILTLKTKISIKNDEFTLQAKICDGTVSLDVMISSEILENLLGFSPCEQVILMREKNHNAGVAERLRNAFSSMQKRLISLNSILIIRFFRSKEMAKVMSIQDLTQMDFSNLASRKITFD